MASKLMIVVGALDDEDHVKTVVHNIDSAIEKWVKSLGPDGDALIRELNSIPKKKAISNSNADGSGLLRYRGEELDTTILIDPTGENLHYELVDLFLSGACRCFIAYGGFVTEDKGDWYLQDGLFSFINIQQILKDPKIALALSEKNCKISIGCRKLGSWASTEDILKNLPTDNTFHVEVMDIATEAYTNGVECGDQISSSTEKEHKKTSHIEEFSDFLEDGIGNEIGGIFSTLKPPLQEGFLKIRNPCLYIFPGGHGDSAFFAVNGFNMLVNGGACTKPWFWKLIQHVDRVDGILATHLGSDNLPGINNLLLRKLQERQVKLPMDNTTPEYKELHRCLISPDLGPLFFNAPAKFLETVAKSGSMSESPRLGKANGASPPPTKEDDPLKHPVLKTVDVVKDTLRLSKALNMEVVPLVRKPGSHQEPITLFSKVGLGRLDMYVLSPSENSKEYTYVNEKWGCNGKTTTPTGRTGVVNAAGDEGDSSVTNLSSMCCLLVWHPSNPHERIVRVLFPGNAPQTKIFEGLETLKHLPFLKSQHVTKHSLSKQKQVSKANGSHAPRSTRPASAMSATKKPASAPPKKAPAPVSGSQVKREVASGAAKPADKRPKMEKPASAKPRPASGTSACGKVAPQKDKAPEKTAKHDAGADKGSSKAATTKKASTRPTGLEAKRQPLASSAKAAPSKPKQAAKVTEKPKKPQTLSTTTAAKQKTETRKAPASASTLGTPSRKGVAKKSPSKPTASARTPSKSDAKASKKRKETPSKAAPPTPPEDLTPEFLKQEADTQKEPEKPSEPVSTESEGPSTSVLSDRHTPEGGDMAPVNYSEVPPIMLDEKGLEKDVEKEDMDARDEVIRSEAPPGDFDLVVVQKPEIADENDFISENGSPLGTEQERAITQDADLGAQLEPPKESDLISSDMSTPEEPKPGKVLTFTVPEKEPESGSIRDKSGSPLARVGDRHPTPFHSLQESSGTTEDSPTDDLLAAGDMEKEASDEIEKEINQREARETNLDEGERVDGRFTEEIPQENIFHEQEDLMQKHHEVIYGQEEQTPCDVPNQQEEVVNQEDEPAKPEEPFAEREEMPEQQHQEQEASQKHLLDFPEEEKQEEARERLDAPADEAKQYGYVADNLRDAGSDIQSSFNSSMEGSYELYPGGRSPPPASDRQETIAETISDFKHDEIPSAKEFEDPSACLDTHPQQVELLEDPSMSTEAPDPRYSISTTSTGSRFARIDSPFSPSEVGLSNTSEYATQPPRTDHVMAQKGETESPHMHAADNLLQDEDVLSDEEEDDKDVDIQDEDDRSQEHPAKPVETELLHADEFGQQMHQGADEILDNDPRRDQAEEEIEDDVKMVEDEDFDLHAGAHQENINLLHDAEYQKEPGIEEQALDNERFLGGAAGDPYATANVDNNEATGESYQEEDEKMQMTGSFASSAQGQGQGEDYSESASLTETGATPDAEHPPVGFDYDGPDVKEYEQAEDEVISKSDLSLLSPGDNFPLHGGNAVGDLLELNGNEEVKADIRVDGNSTQDLLKIDAMDAPATSFPPQTLSDDMDGPAEPIMEGQAAEMISPQRYHPAYIDPSAPLADTEEGHEDGEPLKIDSPLDVNAKPFVPKSSVPFDQSPKYGAEAPFEIGQQTNQDDEFSNNGAFGDPVQAQTVSDKSNNPFLVDLMSNVPADPFAHDPIEEASLPPMRGPDPCAAQDKTGKVNQKKTHAAGGATRKAAPASPPVFVDLTYVPNHANKNSVGVDFFKKIRAKYYVISGNDQSRDEPSKEVLNHLLEGKRSWFGDSHTSDTEDTNVTVIPTHDTTTIREWYQQNFKELESCNIHMVASGSKVLVQVESIEACKIEF